MMAFGRHIVVVAGVQGTQGTRIETLPVSLGTRNASTHVRFTAASSADGQPAKLTLDIFNPPEKLARDLMSDGRGFVSVAAGYVDQADTVVFAGIPVPGGASVQRKEGDLVLHVEALSGGTRYRDAALAAGRAGRVSARDLVEDIAAQGGWVVSRNDIDPNVVYPRGYAMAGSLSAALDRIARYARVAVVYPSGDRVEFVDLDAIDPPNAGFVKAVRFSSDKGNLIGYPERTEDGRIAFDGLISPGVEVGKQVVVRYPDPLDGVTIESRIVVHELSWKGSNYEREFYVHVVGRKVG